MRVIIGFSRGCLEATVLPNYQEDSFNLQLLDTLTELRHYQILLLVTVHSIHEP